MRFKRFLKLIMFGLLSLSVFSCNIYAEEQVTKIGQEDMIYFVLTDRFYDGDSSNNQDVRKESMNSYHGGDFQGIIDKLDYIKDMGFTAIWISPVVENQPGGYHGYWATDFYKTNEHFGTLEKLKELVAKAHKKGIKVIVDLVVNHTGQLHPWVGDTKYEDWFHDYGTIIDYNNQEEVEQGALSALPDLKQENPEVRKYLIDMAKWWIRQTGIDGYRLDTVRHVPKDFWEEFAREIKKEYPDFYMIGEVFDGRADYVAGYQKTGIDGLVDFPVYYAINDALAGSQPATRLAEAIRNSDIYQNRHLMGTFIDNHDVPRFASQASDFKEERLKQALTFMAAYTGIPVMYYGTEIGMEGGADPDNRRDMDWNSKSPVRDYLKKLLAVRKSERALTRGDLKIVKEEAELLCFTRNYEGETIYTALNVSDSEKDVELKLEMENSPKNTVLKDLINSEILSPEGEIIKLKLEPRQARILKLEKQEKVQYQKNTSFAALLAAALAASAALIGVVAFRKKKSKR